MSVRTPIGTWIPSNYAGQSSGTAYPLNIDADIAVLDRLAASFVPQALPTPDLTMQVYEGHVYNAQSQTVGATGNVTSGSTSLGSLSTVAGLTVGMSVTGTGIPAGTNVAGLTASTATLSQAATATGSGEALTFTPQSSLIEVGCNTIGSTTSGSNSLGSLGTVQGIEIGMVATLFSYVGGVLTLAVPSGTIVTGVTNSAVTLSNNATSTVAGASCFFAQPIGTIVTGTTTSGANTLGSLTTTVGMFGGMGVAGTGIPTGATLAGITGPQSATMSTNATSSGSVSVSVTVPKPASNSRLDLVTVNRLTGQANWTIGTAAASPVPPAIPLGQVPIAELLTTNSSTALTNTSSIYDARDFTALGTSPGEFGPQATLASAATVDLGTSGTNNVLVTGTATIASFGSTGSTTAPLYVIQFAGALTLTYNATSLILPGSQNITTAANDRALALCKGGGNWIVLDYQRANGQSASVVGATATLAAAATTDLGTAGSNIVAISGTTTITSLGSSASLGNPLYWVRFTGALTLTYNATSLILPGAANITTAAGDAMLAECLGSGNWRVHYYSKASVAPASTPQLHMSAFTSSGTFTTSGGTNTVFKFTIVGGGGGGGGGGTSSGQGGGGGGAGATAIYEASGVAGGTGIAVTVGAGAAGGATSASGSTGSSSTIVFNGTTVTASGGVGGVNGLGSSPTGGAGGSATNGTINIGGGGGGGAAVYSSSSSSGIGGASSLGGGGASVNGSGGPAAGNAGEAPGSGGSGGADTGAGGAGAAGIVIIEWVG